MSLEHQRIVWALVFLLLPVTSPATPALLGLSIVPSFLALLVMLGISAAAVSTVNSIILTLSSMVCRDVYKNVSTEAAEEKELLIGKLFVPLFTALIVAFATLRFDLIAALSVASSAGLLVMVPALFGSFFWKRGTAAGVLASIVSGGLVATIFQYGAIRPLGLWPGVWSGLVAVTLFILVSLATKAPEKKAEEFIGYLAEELGRKNIL